MRGECYLTQPRPAHGQVEAGLRAGEADGVTGGWRGLSHVKPEAVLVMTGHKLETLALLNCSLRSTQSGIDRLYTHIFLTWDSRLPASSDLSRAGPGPRGDARPSAGRRRGGWSGQGPPSSPTTSTPRHTWPRPRDSLSRVTLSSP